MQRTVDSLEDVAPDERGGYIEVPGGGYALHPDLVACIDKHEADLAALKARAVKAEGRIRSAVISRAVYSAIEGVGVVPAMRKAVGALLEAEFDFDVIDEAQGPQAYALSAYGPVSVAAAVSSWVQSDDGEPYRPKAEKTVPGRYGEMMRGLRTVH